MTDIGATQSASEGDIDGLAFHSISIRSKLTYIDREEYERAPRIRLPLALQKRQQHFTASTATIRKFPTRTGGIRV